ncbi:lysozyme inhibitor [Salmonella enterica subsp. enterica]|uniref:Lysozyme inhibitor n=1 Tax=Salmonella enterica I TaxID=59201 RepID=A0A379VRY7_SALET|nr:lysozyme inhibitor [Salmonella enterica subsp. enterica]
MRSRLPLKSITRVKRSVFVYDNKLLTLKQGISASGARYTDGIYVFWSQGESATVYKRDRIVLNNCQLQNPKR